MGDSVTLRLVFPQSTAFTLTWKDDLGNLPCPIAYQVFSVNKSIDSNVPIQERQAISSKEDPLKIHPECQQRGKYFKNFEYDIKVDENVQPEAHPARRVPLEVRGTLKEKFNEMIEKGRITKVEEPTRWANSLVVKTN